MPFANWSICELEHLRKLNEEDEDVDQEDEDEEDEYVDQEDEDEDEEIPKCDQIEVANVFIYFQPNPHWLLLPIKTF